MKLRPPKLQKFERAEIKGQVIIHNEEHLFVAPIGNISAGGLFIEQLMAIPFGSQVRIVIKSSKFNTPIQALGNVVRIEDKDRRGMAVEFTQISKTARDYIKHLIVGVKSEQEFQIA
jgi:Tfp pilus assembly protein PilZ